MLYLRSIIIDSMELSVRDESEIRIPPQLQQDKDNDIITLKMGDLELKMSSSKLLSLKQVAERWLFKSEKK